MDTQTYKVYQQDNAVWIVDNLTLNTNYIALHNFSFEIDDNTGTVQLADSSIEKKVDSMLLNSIQDAEGNFIDRDGSANTIALYLGKFPAPSGEVSLQKGSAIQIVDEINVPLPVTKDAENGFAKGLILMGEDLGGVLRRIRVEPDGRLISSASVVNPPNTTSIGDTKQSSVSSSVDDDTLIPNGETIIIQILSGGAEGDGDGSKVELFEFTDAEKTSGTLLGVLYVNGSNGSLAINRSFVGDGNAIITLRRSRLSGSAKEIFGKWDGYY